MSRTKNNLTLVCYDIVSDRLRRKIDKTMKDFGQRLQFSVFLCRIDRERVMHMRETLSHVLEKYADERESSDSLIIFKSFAPGAADCLLGAKIERDVPAFGIF